MSAAPGFETLRRYWPALASALGLALLSSVHSIAFGPLAGRYRALLHDAGELGAPLDARLALAPLPPRVTELLRRNSVAAAEADRMSQSGSLGTDLVRRVAGAAVGCGLDVAASEPGSLAQTMNTLEVRARIKLHGRYTDVVRLLDVLSREGSLYRVEELSLQPLAAGRVEARLEVARVLLKRGAPAAPVRADGSITGRGAP